ncbi:DNA polymerase III subunit alpha [Coxiella endosymbiont of Amblyomma nuttalli]|uniref:DNA polymerase III subunit alpha n=1 Tax=Coxiella endosymbiont of Amblyomma nuttalli TaxID=2749996 RepID=UPI001BAD22AB|nr:DNA polymerase III subunit alpha [Coxiella endosymbiont of Amblyomma nuttalli]QTS83864.1 DNA polymerase III subunit alpha [Coxiella endosymbiont of Amblyomma nuttalli]
MNSFIHLSVHSEYSIIDSVVRVNQLLQRVADLKMSAVALTDEVNLFALVKFYCAAFNRGIKPIIGSQLLLIEGNEIFRLTVLCQNSIGLHHLIQLLSRAYVEGRTCNQVLIRWEWLVEARGGLIILSGGRHGDVGQALLQNRCSLAEERLMRWLDYFPDSFYLELQRTKREQEEDYICAAVKLALIHDVPVVATNDVRFLHQTDFEAHEARVCINQGYLLEDTNRPRVYSDQQYLKNAEEMWTLFSDIPEALENTIEIAKRCNVQMKFGEVFLPKFPVPGHLTIEDYFHQQAKKGLEERLAKLKTKKIFSRKSYDDRLETEITVITKMGFSSYFLIVSDFVAWAKQHYIPVGPGRGSGAGSLVAYSLGITELDPLEHELLFERFLNLERVSMPDFDIDFCMEGRDRVIDYVAERYGTEAVAQIITYGTMTARAVLRDVGRVLGLAYGYVDKIAKLIPFELGMTLEKALEQEAMLAKRYAEDDEIKSLINLAMKLEGLTRNAGKHAGGVVIAPTQLTDFVPLYSEPDSNHLMTQFDKDDLEAIGLVKFDFLGLRTLTIINWTVRDINSKRKVQNKSLLDISTISLKDESTYTLLKSCATTAVFQLESRGMKELIHRLQPDNFADIMALVALFRPGPLQSGMVDTFIACKHGKQAVHYLHSDLESILRSTYGVILYQEQVMQIAQVLAGYSLGAADVLRYAMGKKKPQEMAKQRTIFMKGTKARGIDKNLSTQLFDLIEKFSGYGFNKSHSASYALITYQTAWLKAHYPAEFMASVLSSDMDNNDKVVSLIHECHDMGLEILAPTINRGHYYFTVNMKGQIEYGLGAIKGVGEAAISHIVACRETKGKFSGLFDFCHRIDLRKVSRRILEPLIRSGSMDDFGVSRASLSESLNLALQSAEQKNRNKEFGQHDLFRNAYEKAVVELYIIKSEWDTAKRLKGERETLGLYVTGHPLDAYEKEMKIVGATSISQLHISENAVVVGIMMGIRMIATRSGKRIAVLALEDRTGRIEIILFSDLYQKVAMNLDHNAILVVRGSVGKDTYRGGFRLMANTLITLNQIHERMVKRLLIRISSAETDYLLSQLPSAIESYIGGQCSITIAYQGETAAVKLALGDTWKIKPSGNLLHHLSQLFGDGKVEFEY